MRPIWLFEFRTPNQAKSRSSQDSMSGWEHPRQGLLDCSEPIITGRGLGTINRKYFEPATWDPLLSTEMGRTQYGKFVSAMVERIHIKESNFDEIRSFVHLVGTEHNWDFMRIAMPYLPELKEEYPHDSKNFELALLFLLKPKIRRRNLEETQRAMRAYETYECGLSNTGQQRLRREMFGPDRGEVYTPGMIRLFKSTLQLGYPKPALDPSVRQAKERGTEGLPTNMLMPNADTRSDKFSSSSHSHSAGTPAVWTPGTTAESSTVPSRSGNEGNIPIDCSPPGILTDLPFDGIDPPVSPPSYKTRTLRPIEDMSLEELAERNRTEDFEGFLAHEAEPPPRPSSDQSEDFFEGFSTFESESPGVKWPSWAKPSSAQGQSHGGGETAELNQSEDFSEGWSTMDSESPGIKWPSRAKPSSAQRQPRQPPGDRELAKSEAFKHKGSANVSLEFDKLDPIPDPPMPEPGIKWPTLSGSSSAQGQSLGGGAETNPDESGSDGDTEA